MRRNVMKLLIIALTLTLLLGTLPTVLATGSEMPEVIPAEEIMPEILSGDLAGTECPHSDVNQDYVCDLCTKVLPSPQEDVGLGDAVLLGLVQGVAEFLPISSSGHLAIFQKFLGMSQQDDMFFDILLHLATLCAVFVAYWSEIKAIVLEFFTMIGVRKLPKGQQPDRLSRRMIVFIILATLPLFLVLPIKDSVEGLKDETLFIGCALLVTGLLLFLSDRMSRGRKDIRNATILDAVLVGCAQALATVPGLSRSGTTISAGMARGFSREFAVKFSFLMSIPAIAGAFVLELVDVFQAGVNWNWMYLVGMAVAAVSGYLSIRLLKFISQRGSFGGFSYYCWGAGLVTVILSLIYA